MVMSAIQADLDTIFETATFSTTAKIVFSATNAVAVINGMFDREDVPIDNQLSDMFDNYAKVTKLTCKSSDVSDIAINDKITIGGTDYYLAYQVDDGQGVVELMLSTETL